MPQAKEDDDYYEDLAQKKYVEDPDEDRLYFTLVRPNLRNHPKVSEAGIFSWNPKAPDVGSKLFEIRVEDRKAGSITCLFSLTVEHVNHPPKWNLDTIALKAKQETPIPTTDSYKIARFAKDPDGDTLAFRKEAGEPWLSVASNGQVSGTSPNAGNFRFTVVADDSNGGITPVTLIMEVEPVNHPPVWNVDPVPLPNGPEKTDYLEDLRPFVKDPDVGDILSFKKAPSADCADWIIIRPDGIVTGYPDRSDVGLNKCVVRAVDRASLFKDVTIHITIDKVNTPPRWRQHPVVLTTPAYEDSPFAFNLLDPSPVVADDALAVDDDGDSLKFRLRPGGRAWLAVSENGMLLGKPGKPDIGPFSVIVEVTDSLSDWVAEEVKGEVIHVNHPPSIDPEAWNFIIFDDRPFSVNLLDGVTDPDGDTNLTCTIENMPTWFVLSNCQLTMNPTHAQVGFHTISVSVSDGQAATSGPLRVTVNHVPQAPVCRDLAFKAETGVLLRESIEGTCTDSHGVRVTYSMQDPSDWLSLSGMTISGTPGEQHIGPNTFIFLGKSDGNPTEFKVVITVVPGVKTDKWNVDTMVSGAGAENLWVIDANHCNKTIRNALVENIRYYFDALDNAKIHHSAIYLSADPDEWDGEPIRQPNGPYLIKWSDLNKEDDFKQRTVVASASKNCYNSPIWSMFRFYQRVLAIPEVYHNGYMMAGVPMDALIVTNQKDHYRKHANATPQKQWTAVDYVNNAFIPFHKNEKKAYRISAITPKCLHGKAITDLVEQAPEHAWHGDSGAYRVLAEKTGGKIWQVGHCNIDMKSILEEYARSVIFRAYVHAKSRLPLSQKPILPHTMKLTIGGVAIPGNTGAPTDQWYFDGTNEPGDVVIHWYLIDVGQIKPTDQIVVEYRISRKP